MSVFEHCKKKSTNRRCDGVGELKLGDIGEGGVRSRTPALSVLKHWLVSDLSATYCYKRQKKVSPIIIIIIIIVQKCYLKK